MKSLTKNSIYNAIYNFANVIFPLLITSYASRILQPSGIGYVNYAKNYSLYFVTFAALGIPNYGLREIAKVKNNDYLLSNVFSELFIINLFTSIVFTLLYLILVIHSEVFNIDVNIMLCFGILIIMNIFNIDWFYQGIEEYGYILKRSLIVKVISFFMTIAFVKTADDILIFSFINVFSITFNYILNIISVKKYVRISFRELSFGKHLKPLIIIGLSIFLSTVYSKLDITMLGIMTNNINVGLYTSAYKIIEALLMITLSITAVYLPRLSELYDNNIQKFNELINYGIRVLSFVSFPIFAYTLIFADDIVTILFGSGFIDAGITIKILSILIIIKSFGDLLCYQIVLATRKDKIRLISYIFATIANVILNYMLIKKMFHNGAALASVITESIVNFSQFVIIKKVVSYQVYKKNVICSLFNTLVCSILIVLLKIFLPPVLLFFVLESVLMVTIYFIISFFAKNITVLKNN